MSSTVREFFELGPSHRDHIPALRIAVSVALPLVVLVLLGREDLTIYAAFGAFTSIYARHEPTAMRLKHQAQAGALVVSSVALGVLLSVTGAGEIAVLIACCLVASAGAVLAAAAHLKPAGSVFLIFAAGAVGSLGPQAVAHPAVGIGVALASAVFSALLGVLWTRVGEGPSQTTVHVDHAGPTRSQLAAHGGRFLVATALAAAVALPSGLSHTYWALVAAAAPIAAPTHKARLQRGVHRMVGTLGGVGVTAFVLSMHLQTWHMVVFVVLFQFLAELWVGRNYSLALLWITPLALLMTQLARPTGAAELLEARALETVIGAVCGLAVVWAWRSREERRADTQAIPTIRRAADQPGD